MLSIYITQSHLCKKKQQQILKVSQEFNTTVVLYLKYKKKISLYNYISHKLFSFSLIFLNNFLVCLF
jgi:hypothetical protein